MGLDLNCSVFLWLCIIVFIKFSEIFRILMINISICYEGIGNKINRMERQKKSIKQISMRAKTMKEVFRILQLEGDIFLPPIAQTDKKYIAEILAGKKKVSKTVTVACILFEELSTHEYPSSTFNWLASERHINFCKK